MTIKSSATRCAYIAVNITWWWNSKNQRLIHPLLNRFAQLCKAADRIGQMYASEGWDMEGNARREWTDNVSLLFRKASSVRP